MLKKRVFFIFFIIIFSIVAGVGVVVPIFPIYASVLANNGMEVGFILGAFSLSRGVFLVYFGKKFDVVKKKSHIIIGLLFYTAIPLGYICCRKVEFVVFFRVFQGMASSIIVSFIYTYISKFSLKGREGKISGIFNISVFMGMVIGPFLGGLFLDRFGNSSVFLLMSFLSLFGLLICFLFVPSKIAKKNGKIINEFYWLVIFGDLSFFGVICIRLSYTFCMGIIWNFIPVLSFSKYSSSFFSIGFLVTFGVFISGILNVPVSVFSDIVDRRVIINLGILLILFNFLLFFFANSFFVFFYLNMFFGVSVGLLNPFVFSSVITLGNKNNAAGFMLSLFTTSHSAGMVLGSFLSGYIIYFGISEYIFLFGTLLGLVGFFVFTIFVRKLDLIHDVF